MNIGSGKPSRGRKRLFTDEQLIALHERGLNDREKAEELGATEGAVSHHRRRLGLAPNFHRSKVVRVSVERKRFSVTLSPFYLDRIDHLVEKGIFSYRQNAIRAAVRNLFQFHGMEPIPKELVEEFEEIRFDMRPVEKKLE